MEQNDISLYRFIRKRNGFNDEPVTARKENGEKDNSNAPAPLTSNQNHLIDTALDNNIHTKELLNSIEGYYKPSSKEQQEYLRIEALIKDVLQNNLEKLLNHPISKELDKGEHMEIVPEENAASPEENILDYDYELQVMMDKEQKRIEEEQRRAKDLAEVKKLSTSGLLIEFLYLRFVN